MDDFEDQCYLNNYQQSIVIFNLFYYIKTFDSYEVYIYRIIKA